MKILHPTQIGHFICVTLYLIACINKSGTLHELLHMYFTGRPGISYSSLTAAYLTSATFWTKCAGIDTVSVFSVRMSSYTLYKNVYMSVSRTGTNSGIYTLWQVQCGPITARGCTTMVSGGMSPPKPKESNTHLLDDF